MLEYEALGEELEEIARKGERQTLDMWPSLKRGEASQARRNNRSF